MPPVPIDVPELGQGAVELKPIPHHYFMLANVCYRSGDRAAGLAAIEEALKTTPDSAQYQRLRELLQKEE